MEQEENLVTITSNVALRLRAKIKERPAVSGISTFES